MATSKFVVLIDDIGGWFKKVFKAAPNDTVRALAVINQVAPEAEIVFSLVDPAAAAVANPIINEATADLGTVASMLKQGQTDGIAGYLGGISSNLQTLIKEGHISNPTSQQRATGIVNGIIAAFNSVLQLFPQGVTGSPSAPSGTAPATT